MTKRLPDLTATLCHPVLGLLGALTILTAALLPAARGQTGSSTNPSLLYYTHGDPSADEQYLLELLNAARANPAAEGLYLAAITDPTILSAYQYFSVDTAALAPAFASYPARPPLAFNAKLLASSRAQALDQAAHGFQGHDGSDGSTLASRITATGYDWVGAGENTYTYVSSPLFGFVGTIVDWGVSALDHRANMLNPDSTHPPFKETGISYVPTSIGQFGPYVFTEDFAVPNSAAPLLLGVVYDDVDQNNFYTQGEGATGVVITSPQSSYYTITSASGGYALPLDQVNGATVVEITFDDARGHHLTRQVACANDAADNVKADLVTRMSGGSFHALSIVPVRDASRLTMKKGKLRILREGADHSTALTVHYEVSGSATPGEDYKPLKGWAVIPAGEDSVVVKVRPLPGDDTVTTGQAEQVTVTLLGVDEDPAMAWGTSQAGVAIQ